MNKPITNINPPNAFGYDDPSGSTTSGGGSGGK